MKTTIIFESHATSVDNERKLASGWSDVELSELGKQQSFDLGKRYETNLPDIVVTSDLRRAIMTAQIAFGDKVEVMCDARLRECNYGEMAQKPSSLIEMERKNRINTSFPDGEDFEMATKRVMECVRELVKQYRGKKIMIIGHRATQYGIERLVERKSLEEIVGQPWEWKPGWIYYVSDTVTQ